MSNLKVFNATRGQCLCGQIKYELNGEVSSFHLCYCSRCRHSTGSAHAANVFTKPEAIKWICGEEQIKRFELAQAKSFAKQFCQNCAGAVPYLNKAGTFLVVPAGSLVDEIEFGPDDRIFTDSKAKWTECIFELPTFERYPDKF
ncbi:GFA family protein (plasmid) [Pseudoalteromonas xiamenensis]|uniref:GFA family protein n=1 Tax=Pseudoalteromonas xiamenensis TaxID=882626 RepID=UPI0027E43144|nr:GFA family protein [Pseudoalteromonas xiamenensis]WMN61813.1 GFA family protein [Pseudoalteromonas xiamenensis]